MYVNVDTWEKAFVVNKYISINNRNPCIGLNSFWGNKFK